MGRGALLCQPLFSSLVCWLNLTRSPRGPFFQIFFSPPLLQGKQSAFLRRQFELLNRSCASRERCWGRRVGMVTSGHRSQRSCPSARGWRVSGSAPARPEWVCTTDAWSSHAKRSRKKLKKGLPKRRGFYNALSRLTLHDAPSTSWLSLSSNFSPTASTVPCQAQGPINFAVLARVHTLSVPF